jgi:hypothetical protein
MKAILSLGLLLTVASLYSQNGITAYPMPTGYTNLQVSPKTALAADNSGNAWIGFKNNVGIGKFDGTNWTMYDTTNTPMTTANITALAVHNGNFVWAGASLTTTKGELFSFNGNAWTNYTAAIDSAYVNVICADNAVNTVWVGTKSGLWRLGGSGFTHFTVANSGLASDSILSLAIDPSGNLLVGTQRGLSVKNGNSWTNYSSANINFPYDNIRAIYADATNGTWISAGGLVGKFTPPYFQLIDSILPTPAHAYPTTNHSIARGPHGGAIFGGDRGFIEIISGQPDFYFPNVPTHLLATNPVTGHLWSVRENGQALYNKLYSFDGTYTHELLTNNFGITPDNAKYLDVNYVKTGIFNRGNKGGLEYETLYEVPKGGGTHTLLASGLWIGGMDNGGVLHVAASVYNPGADYFPGPLDTINGTIDSVTAAQYDYIWEITKINIREFQYYWSTGDVQNGTYIPAHDILTWPAHGTGNYTRNMAPFVDVDGNGIYNPLTGGDYPLIKGDEMLYCIYNDNLAVHQQTDALPMKVEIHASAYAYYCEGIADSQKVVNYTTYYDYQIFNRSNDSYNNAYIGMFHDMDIGYFNDDQVGCVSTENFSFAANTDNYDGFPQSPQPATYGANPPISSYAILNGPAADPGDGIDNDNDGTMDEAGEINLMTGHLYFENHPYTPIGNPVAADDFYLFMSGKWRDSTDVTYGGNGYGGTTPTRFMFDGLPYDTAAWVAAPAWDRRSLTSCGPFTLSAGQSVNFNYAIVYSRDTTVGAPDTAYYDQAVNDVRRIRNWYNTNTTPSCVQWAVGINEAATTFSEMSLFPNPASTLLTIEYKAESKNAQYQLLDLTGRVLGNGTIMNGGQTTISVEDLPAGIYLVRIIDTDHTTARKFIRQ